MKNVLIMGASGMIGRLCLTKCLENKEVAEVTVLVRKPLGIDHPKLTEIVHSDFYDYSAAAPYLQNKDVCFYCIGVYTGQVNKKEFTKRFQARESWLL